MRELETEVRKLLLEKDILKSGGVLRRERPEPEVAVRHHLYPQRRGLPIPGRSDGCL